VNLAALKAARRQYGARSPFHTANRALRYEAVDAPYPDRLDAMRAGNRLAGRVRGVDGTRELPDEDEQDAV
jgi:hypothetical protein